MDRMMQDYVERALVPPGPQRLELLGLAFLFEHYGVQGILDQQYRGVVDERLLDMASAVNMQRQLVQRLAVHLDEWPDDAAAVFALSKVDRHVGIQVLVAYATRNAGQMGDSTYWQTLVALENMVWIDEGTPPDPVVREALSGWDIRPFLERGLNSSDEMCRLTAHGILRSTAIQLR
jgi:hypothetical protein